MLVSQSYVLLIDYAISRQCNITVSDLLNIINSEYIKKLLMGLYLITSNKNNATNKLSKNEPFTDQQQQRNFYTIFSVCPVSRVP